MNISYENSIEKYFEDYELMRKKIGDKYTKATKKRINQLRAYSDFEHFLKFGLGKPHSLSGNLKNYYGLGISDNVRMVLRPMSEDLKSETFKKCDTVKIKGVGDYHGNKINWLIS